MKTIIAQIYVGNMQKRKANAIASLSPKQIEHISGFHIRPFTSKTAPYISSCDNNDDLLTWLVRVDDKSPEFKGDAFARADFIDSILDSVGG